MRPCKIQYVGVDKCALMRKHGNTDCASCTDPPRRQLEIRLPAHVYEAIRDNAVAMEMSTEAAIEALLIDIGEGAYNGVVLR